MGPRAAAAAPLRAPARACKPALLPPQPQHLAAMVGTWKKGPGVELFQALETGLGAVPILAEDLGVITPDVVALRQVSGRACALAFGWRRGWAPCSSFVVALRQLSGRSGASSCRLWELVSGLLLA